MDRTELQCFYQCKSRREEGRTPNRRREERKRKGGGKVKSVNPSVLLLRFCLPFRAPFWPDCDVMAGGRLAPVSHFSFFLFFYSFGIREMNRGRGLIDVWQ